MTSKQPQKKRAARPNGKKTPSKAAQGPQKAKAPSKSKKQAEHPFLSTLLGLLFLVGVVMATGITVHHLFPPDIPQTTDVPKPSPVKPKEHPVYMHEKPAFEVYPKESEVDEQELEMPHPAEHHPFPERRPEVAIIIDDIGYNRVLARKLMGLDIPITFSVLPHSPHNRELAAEAHGKGIEIMLHLPMEPMEHKVNPGPGALLVSMDVDHMIDILYDDLSDVPYVVGVNNHMGSRLTTVSTRMYQIFTVLKKKDLFFIDSKTSPQSLCKPSARLLQVPFGERDVFLDHKQDKKVILKQLNHLIRIARKTGQAIGIGHPHKETYEVLFEELDRLKSSVRLVYASNLVKTLG